MYLILEQGSKQYKVAEDDEVIFEKMPVAANTKIELSKYGKVLFLSDKSIKTTDEKELKKIKIKAKVLEHFQADKVIAFKYKSKKKYRRKLGHRQIQTRVLIESITTGKKAGGQDVKKVKAKPIKKDIKEVQVNGS